MSLGKQARNAGFLQQPLPPIAFCKWLSNMNEDWFNSNTAFLVYIVQRKLIMPAHIPDNLTVRAIAVFLKYGVAQVFNKCT